MRLVFMALTVGLLLSLWAGLAVADPNHVEEKPWAYPEGFYNDRATYPEDPNNDICPGPQTITCGDVIDPAELTPSGDHDWYVITIDQTYQVSIGTDDTEPPQDTDTYLELYADDCTTLLATDDDGGPSYYSLITETLDAGTYNVKVRGYGDFATGTYKMFVDCVEPPPTDCPHEGYTPYTDSGPYPIPDDTPQGLIAGPIEVDCFEVLDLVVALDISHTWTGDVIVDLVFDDECDGIDAEDLYASLLCRADLLGCECDGCCGCSDDLADEYWFSDDATGPLAEPCPYTYPIAPGCFTPAVESPNGLRDLAEYANGCWYLVASDCAGGDTGTIWGWALWFLEGQPTAIENVTWGTMKVFYSE